MRFTLPVFALALSACSSALPPQPPPMSSPIPVAPAASSAAAPTLRAEAEAPSPAPGDERFAAVTIKVQKVAGAVYLLEGEGGNIAVSVGEDGIVLVDDQFAPLAPKIKAALQGISARPVTFVLNTHWHGDHTGGNVVFGRGSTIVAHENVRKRMVTGRPPFELGGKPRPAVPPAAKVALPVVTFQDKVSVHFNGEEIRAIHLPGGHTDGDAIIYFTKSNVVHLGDDFVTYGFPFVDVDSGGTVRGIIAAMNRAVKELPPDVKVIPGHGALSTLEDVKKLAAALEDCVKRIEAAVKKGQTLEQIKAAKVLAAHAGLDRGLIKADAFVEIVFKELKTPRAR